MKKKMMVGLCIALSILLIFGIMYILQKEENIEDAGLSKNAPIKQTSLFYNDNEYPLKKHLQTVLLIGTDSTEEYEELPENERNFYSYHQADFLLLLVFDKDADTVEMIQINRDTMTDVPWLDIFGSHGGTEYKQICLAFNYGDGGRSSCNNTVKAVSSLLFEAPIDGYVQIPMTAIPRLNDLAGGVPVTFNEDLTAIDPAFINGQTVKLTGAQAEKFVRARKGLETDTNIARMKRQRDYMDSFYNCINTALESDPEFLIKLAEEMGTTMQTNMTSQKMAELINEMQDASVLPISYADGKLQTGERYYEFYVDTDSLWEIIRNAYCTAG